MRSRLVVPLLAVAGVAGAVGLGFAVNEISGDSIGLSAEPLQAGESLAPPSASQGRTRRRRGRSADRDLRRRTASPAEDRAARPTEAAPDDKGGRGEDESGRGRGRGRGSGGGGSDSSGPGSSDDRSGGSGSGGSGSDD